jgi:hypothetical protein
MELLTKTAHEAQKAMEQLLNTVENNLGLAKHAETREWKEVTNHTQGANSD